MKKKVIVGSLFLIIIIGGSLQVAYANEDIGAMLKNWFDNKTEESIIDIDQAIETERQKQTERLKEELQSAIKLAEQEMDQFVQKEKSHRTEQLEKHVDLLIEEMDIDTTELQEEIAVELDLIIEEAKQKIEHVLEQNEE